MECVKRMGKRGGSSERGDLVLCSALDGSRGCESLGGWFGVLQAAKDI